LLVQNRSAWVSMMNGRNRTTINPAAMYCVSPSRGRPSAAVTWAVTVSQCITINCATLHCLRIGCIVCIVCRSRETSCWVTWARGCRCAQAALTEPSASVRCSGSATQTGQGTSHGRACGPSSRHCTGPSRAALALCCRWGPWVGMGKCWPELGGVRRLWDV
jgi:hypothetical protein